MNMKLYGICFKLRGGPDLLSHVQANEPVPVEMMGQVMDQVGSLTKDELDFAQLIMDDWKKAFSDKVPLTMTVNEEKGYDITCNVSDELISAISLVTGKEPGELVKEYTADHMKNVLGIEADILSVDVEHEDAPAPVPVKTAPVQAAPAAGFSLADLDESPETPAFEDVSSFADTDMGMDIPVEGFPVHEEETAPDITAEEELPFGEPEADETEPYEIPEDDGMVPEDEDENIYGDEQDYEDEQDHEDDGEPDEFIEPDIPEEDGVEEGKDEEKETDEMTEAISGIYKDMVQNIRNRNLDTRLGLKIGQRQPQ